ncbi:IS3 family transposase [Leifsonia aquatica]|uniref:IS3 family transposase n=1 Tax=Leifsonia aquatica TaxID=144185 RepID=UPI003812E000
MSRVHFSAPTSTADTAVSQDALAHLDPSLSTDLKGQIVQSLSGTHPVTSLLRALRLPRSTYYYRRSRPTRIDRYEEVRPLVRTEFAAAYNAYGYRRLRTQLQRRHGVAISGKTMRRLMCEEGCHCTVRKRRRRPRPRPVNSSTVFAPNRLQRDFSADEPGQKWVTDVTQFIVAGKRLFLSPLLDLYNGEVISYRFGDEPNMPMVLGMVRDAAALVRPSLTTLHSDRGWQYQHQSFRAELDRNHILQSMSRSGNCHDNAVAENFFSHFKQEFLRGRHTRDIAQLASEIDTYLNWYNLKRINTRANGNSPVDYRLALQGPT